MTQLRLAAFALCVGLVASATPAFARPLGPDCSKIEGSAIGHEGAIVRVGEVSATLSGWLAKPGEHGEYVGFSYDTSGGQVVSITVKAGRDRYLHEVWSTFGSWAHPEGDAGKAVSHVVVCVGARVAGDAD